MNTLLFVLNYVDKTILFGNMSIEDNVERHTMWLNVTFFTIQIVMFWPMKHKELYPMLSGISPYSKLNIYIYIYVYKSARILNSTYKYICII